jgi:hypothetical protein
VTTPYARSTSDTWQPARSTVNPSGSDRDSHSRSNAVFPIPGSPSTTTTQGLPAFTYSTPTPAANARLTGANPSVGQAGFQAEQRSNPRTDAPTGAAGWASPFRESADQPHLVRRMSPTTT